MSYTFTRRGPALAVASLALITILLAGCGSAGGEAPSASRSPNPSGSSADADALIAASGVTDDTSFCGDKDITLGIHDAFGSNGWSKSSMAAVRTEAAKCSNVTQVVEIGGGSLQKSISDINGMVAQGIDALVVIPSLGEAQLPALSSATRAGVQVVTWAANAGGTPGTDYVDYIDWDPREAGVTWAKWMVKALDGKGDVVFLGGPAGNPVTAATLDGVAEVFADNPDMKLLTGTDDWPVTNWDPAEAQRTMAALLARYPKIDGVITEDGQGSVGAIRAFVAAGRPLVPFTALEVNDVACTFDQYKPDNPAFEFGTISSRNWLGRIAARKAIAAAQGIDYEAPSLYSLPLLEDSLDGTPPVCDSSLPADAFIDSKLTADDIEKLGGTS